MRIEGAELTIYTTNGENLSIDLSPTQLKAIVGILGISFNGNMLNCFSDESVNKLYEMTIGKLKPLD